MLKKVLHTKKGEVNNVYILFEKLLKQKTQLHSYIDHTATIAIFLYNYTIILVIHRYNNHKTTTDVYLYGQTATTVRQQQ